MVLEKKEQQQGDFSKKVGIGEFRIVGVNPNLDQLKKILNTDKVEKEPVYLETKDGKDKLTICFWVEDVKSGNKYPYRFNLINEPKIWEKSGKTVYVNQVAQSATVLDEKDLGQWFTHFTNKEKQPIGEKNYRKAIVGEAELYSFMRNWISQVDYFSPNTDIMLDIKKLFRGNVSELADLVGSELVGTVVLALYVAIVDKEGEVKQYQNIWKDSLPGYQMKKLNLAMSQNSWDADKVTKEFKDKLVGPEYSITSSGANVFVLGPIVDFVESEHLNAGSSTISFSEDTKVNDTDY